jgi:hypothetical protein
VVSNKLLYFETMHMLAYIGISHEHLDPTPWARADGVPCSGSRQRVCSRREGLRNFRSGEARVLVLNLLVSRVADLHGNVQFCHVVMCLSMWKSQMSRSASHPVAIV